MKRCIDILVSTSGLVAFAIPVLVLMGLITMTSPGPALYWSQRVGRNGKMFNMPKLRTMVVHTPLLPTHELKNAEIYITGIGNFLRQSSLDELAPMVNDRFS